MEHFDVAIIGLGPAGAALARQLSGKMRVIALDKKRQCGNEGFTKPCGGLLAPDAQRSFIRDGITLPVDVIANPQIFSVKTIDVAASLTRNYQRSYININRHATRITKDGLNPLCTQRMYHPLCPIHSYIPAVNLEKQNFMLPFTFCSSCMFLRSKKTPGPFGAGVLVR